MNTESISSSLHLGDKVTQVLDGLDLLLEEVTLQEVCHLSVVVLAGSGMDLQERLFDKRIIKLNVSKSLT